MNTSPADRLIGTLDTALRTLFSTPRASRECPTLPETITHLEGKDRALSASLMRVNHVGEVCAQALYTAQAHATANPHLRAHFESAARDETDHLAWTRTRLDELGARPSLLNPLWYAGAFGLGLIAGRLGDAWSLGFVAETEKQVEAHLESHLGRLPVDDHASRAIVAQMRDDEARHGAEAVAAGALQLPAPVRAVMAAAARVMTTTAHYV